MIKLNNRFCLLADCQQIGDYASIHHLLCSKKK